MHISRKNGLFYLVDSARTPDGRRTTRSICPLGEHPTVADAIVGFSSRVDEILVAINHPSCPEYRKVILAGEAHRLLDRIETLKPIFESEITDA